MAIEFVRRVNRAVGADSGAASFCDSVVVSCFPGSSRTERPVEAAEVGVRCRNDPVIITAMTIPSRGTTPAVMRYNLYFMDGLIELRETNARSVADAALGLKPLGCQW
jgi:hypothetical protein